MPAIRQSLLGGQEPVGRYIGAALGGIVGGVVLGIVFYLVDSTIWLANVHGVGRNITLGWVFVLVYGPIGGLIYAAIAQLDPVARYAAGIRTGIGLGLGYGVVLWVVTVVLLTPILAAAVGTTWISVPHLNFWPLLGFLAYGAIVGGGYGYLQQAG